MRVRTVILSLVGAGVGWVAWELLKPGLRPAVRRAPAVSDLLAARSPGFTAVDSWAAPMAPEETDDAGEWVWAMTNSMSALRVLMVIRDALVRPFGVAQAARGPEYMNRLHDVLTGQAEAGDDYLFQKTDRGDHEIVACLDDSHLDCRLGVTTSGGEVVFTTTFQVHNLIGRLYWGVVRWFHPLVVRAMLRQARVPVR
jgi:hypothetical protein